MRQSPYDLLLTDPHPTYHMPPTIYSLRHAQGSIGALGVDGIATFDDFTNDSIAADDERDAVGEQACEVQNSVGLGRGFLRIAQEGEGRANLAGELLIPRRAVHADADYLRAGLLEFGDISLIRLHLAASARSRGAEVESQNHNFPAAKLAQLDDFPILIG